jgi:hypothetical protein
MHHFQTSAILNPTQTPYTKGSWMTQMSQILVTLDAESFSSVTSLHFYSRITHSILFIT